MDDVHCIPFRETGYFSKLIGDYLNQEEALKPFYDQFPSLESLEAQMVSKSGFPEHNRKVLVDVLNRQYQSLSNSDVEHKLSVANIQRLASPETFTITTGHQLCLFTGPIYFIYKIVSTVNLAKRLSKRYPTKNFVPVYWMASEDHDFEEVNHINLDGGRISWNLEASGAVGHLKTKSLQPIIDELKILIGPGEKAESLIKLLKEAYLGNQNLAEATRHFVQELFGHKGLVVLDADDSEFKRLAKPYFIKDLKESLPFKEVIKTSEKLGELYFNQINPRPINLFYLKDRIRERIEKIGDNWKVLNTDINWNEQELDLEYENHPERFSPNVVLRPLFQEVILPNLAYIGGGGELAYWFQLKGMFDSMEIPFPQLILRNSVLGYSEKQKAKLDKLDLDISQLFDPLHEIQNKMVTANAPVDTSLSEYELKLEEMFNDLEIVANLTDKSMLGAVNAQRQKQLNGLANLKNKLLRAEKRKDSERMERVERIHEELYPKGGLQERHDNFISYYLQYGPNWIDQLFKALDPLKSKFICMVWR